MFEQADFHGLALPAWARLSRRSLLKAAASLTVLVNVPAFGGAVGVLAVRVWPARDYTRVTLESQGLVKFSYMTVKEPERLVVDLEGVEFNSVIQGLPGKISEDDPYIRNIRAGRNRPGVVRLVVELKSEINPQLFVLPPAGEYSHRLVMDLFPTTGDSVYAQMDRRSEPQGRADVREARAEPRQEPRREPVREARAEQRHEEDERPAKRKSAKADRDDDGVDRLVTVVIDPGHGGEDPGAVGRAGTYEKNVTLAVARRLKSRLDSQANFRTVLTRDGDYFIPLHHRVAKARKAQADLFVSVHADSWINPEARGSSVFALSEKGASSTAARMLAEKENAADLIGGVNLNVKDPFLARTLLDLSQTATINDSLKLGKSMLGELGGLNRLHKASVEQAGFAVLKAPDIPSILVETAFISNPEEEARLTDEAYQDRLAEAMMRGIKKYFAKSPPLARNKMA